MWRNDVADRLPADPMCDNALCLLCDEPLFFSYRDLARKQENLGISFIDRRIYEDAREGIVVPRARSPRMQ
jgi:hypothetical protein